MRGFVELESTTGHGRAWVRLAHVTAVNHIRYRHGGDPVERHLISVLAGGEWWTDDEQPTAEAAEARLQLLTGQRRSA